MSRIVTVDDFCKFSSRRDLNADELERLLNAAEQIINVNIGGRLSEYDIFPERVRNNISAAICAQTEHIAADFGTDLSSVMPQSATIGSFSYSLGSGDSSGQCDDPSVLCGLALTYLRASGLLYRGVAHEN